MVEHKLPLTDPISNECSCFVVYMNMLPKAYSAEEEVNTGSEGIGTLPFGIASAPALFCAQVAKTLHKPHLQHKVVYFFDRTPRQPSAQHGN